MGGVVFAETLRRSWRQVIYWGIGLFVWALYPFIMLPDMDALADYADLVEELPPALVSAIGMQDAASFGTPEGFVGYAYFGFLLLILSVFGVIAGLNVSANEEESGALDVMLSLPVPRWRVIVEKVAAYSLMAVGIVLVGHIGLMVGDSIATIEMNIDAMRYLEGSLSLLPGTWFVIVVTAFLGTVIRRRSTAMAVAGGFVTASYMLDMVGRAAQSDVADAIRQVSYFAHYNGSEVLSEGLAIGSIVLVLAVSVILFLSSLQLFERREIAL